MMNRRDRKKQQKKKARAQRLRQEKHGRQAPASAAEDELQETASAKTVPSPDNSTLANSEIKYHVGGVPNGPLDNFFLGEPAQKWLDELLAGTDSYSIVKTLDPAEYVPGHLLLKASVCCEMLVAAEMVAAGIGRPSGYLPLRAAAWLLEQDVLFSPGVVMLAATAVRRVGEFSELRQLWDAVKLSQEWLAGVDGLCSRLQV
jgi:hypothetical protein